MTWARFKRRTRDILGRTVKRDPASKTYLRVQEAIAKYDTELSNLKRGTQFIVVVAGRDPDLVAKVVAESVNGGSIAVLCTGTCPAASETISTSQIDYISAPKWRKRVRVLYDLPLPDAILDVGGTRHERTQSLRYLSYFLGEGGLYMQVGTDRLPSDEGPVPADNIDLLRRLWSLPMSEFAKESEPNRSLAESLTMVAETPYSVLLRKTKPHYAKLRDWESDEVLTNVYGAEWGTSDILHAATTFTARGEVVSHGPGPVIAGRRTLQLPDLYFREYQNVAVSARQVVRYGRFVLPDSWRHPHQRRLNNRQLVAATQFHGEYLPRTLPLKSRDLEGVYYYLDTELPSHFGHITTDVLSRFWGWDEARRRYPGVRALVSSRTDVLKLPTWQADIFDAYGIPASDVVVVGPREEVIVETLVGVTPLFENPHYVVPQISEDWQRVRKGLAQVEPPVTNSRIFVARKRTGKRECLQHDDVEQFFSSEGFSIVFPEQFCIAEQAAIFSQAKIIGGWAGSGMFSMMFSPDARVILVSSDSYDAHNEELFAAVNGNEIHYFWGESSIPQPPNRWSFKAFTSDWSFNLESYRDELLAAMDESTM